MQSVAEMTSHDVLLNKLSLACCTLSHLPHKLQSEIKGGGKQSKLVDHVFGVLTDDEDDKMMMVRCWGRNHNVSWDQQWMNTDFFKKISVTGDALRLFALSPVDGSSAPHAGCQPPVKPRKEMVMWVAMFCAHNIHVYRDIYLPNHF